MSPTIVAFHAHPDDEAPLTEASVAPQLVGRQPGATVGREHQDHAVALPRRHGPSCLR